MNELRRYGPRSRRKKMCTSRGRGRPPKVRSFVILVYKIWVVPIVPPGYQMVADNTEPTRLRPRNIPKS